MNLSVGYWDAVVACEVAGMERWVCAPDNRTKVQFGCSWPSRKIPLLPDVYPLYYDQDCLVVD